MRKKELERLLSNLKVLQEGHFLLSSGLHSQFYFEKFRILEQPKLLTKFCSIIRDKFQKKKITIVCGPTTGGAIIAYELARQLKAKFIIAEKENDQRKIRRDFSLNKRDRILIVDDVLTTGHSIKETLKALTHFAGKVVGIAVLIDRNEKPIKDFKYQSVYRKAISAYRPEECPLCKSGIPLTKPGSQ